MHDGVLPDTASVEGVLRVFAARAEAELRRVRAEAALRDEAEFRLRLFERASEGICVCHAIPEFPFVRFTSWNARMTEITRLHHGRDQPSRVVSDRLPPDPEVRERAMARMASMREGADLAREEWTITRADGESRTIEISTSLVRDEAGEPHVLAVMHDVTARRAQDRELERLRRFHAELVDTMSEGIAVMDADNRWLYVNAAGARMLGYEPGELIGREGSETVVPEAVSVLDQAVQTRRAGQAERYELTLRHRSGRPIPALVHAVPRLDRGEFAGSLSVFSDLTEQKEADQRERELGNRLRQAQKQEALGRLAAGLAHDFNNLLTVILGATEIAVEKLKAGEPPTEELQSVEAAARRAEALVRSTLSFARRGDDVFRPIGMPALVQGALALLRNTLPSSIEVRASIEPACPQVLGAAAEVEQVLMNLCTNAAQAMRGSPGTLDVSVRAGRLGPDAALRNTDLTEGDYVMLSVTDHGAGMTPEVLGRVFEPYFTTKGVGEGTGLGLASVLGIARRHGGAVDVDSTPGVGSTFVVYFPVAPVSTDAEAEAEVAVAVAPVSLHGHERVLCVDDEPLIASVCLRVLSGYGYDVNVTTSAEDALDRLRAAPEAYDLLLTDHTMPKLTGIALASAARALRPDLPIILCTGQLDWIDRQQAAAAAITLFLEKPFNRAALARAVRAALDGTQVSAPLPPPGGSK
jgi:PAS domain S-box-containing protein